jgi:HAD superfamily hydrolase (TIGR01509 family)
MSVESTLKALGIFDLFTTVVTNEDYARGKPAPDAFLEAAKRLGVLPKRCLAFEDTSIGVQSAESAGMTCVRVPASLRVPNS